ncbi:DUF4405 domain-containing protein [Sulfurimonas sp.]
MNKFFNRDMATSLATLLFVVIGVSGVMMFFHFFDKYVKEMHEILGLAFVVAIFLHVFFNFSSMKKYFKKGLFQILSLIIVSVSLVFVLNVDEGANPKVVIIESMLNAPIQNSANILGTDIQSVKINLEKRGYHIDDKDTIKTISSKNKVSPFEIVDIMSKK